MHQHIDSPAAIRSQYAKLEQGPTASSVQIRLKKCSGFIAAVLPVASSLRVPPAGSEESGSPTCPPASWIIPKAVQWGLHLISVFRRPLLYSDNVLIKKFTLIKSHVWTCIL